MINPNEEEIKLYKLKGFEKIQYGYYVWDNFMEYNKICYMQCADRKDLINSYNKETHKKYATIRVYQSKDISPDEYDIDDEIRKEVSRMYYIK